MTYYDPERYPGWKALLRDGKVDPAFAAAVGDTIGAIHAASAGDADVARRFDTGDLFMALRIEPYLLYTAAAHPDRAERIRAMASGVEHARIALMHGDVSPKNILAGPDGPVFLDAETACYGDPAFDLAFCLNHLLLKCIWVPGSRNALLESFTRLRDAYFVRVGWESPADLDRRTAGLLAAFLLARIDGKSPVEYITDENDKAFVRAAARDFLAEPVLRLDDIRDGWRTRLGTL
jgi:aminoglycoside phosphotransferase (APT) family kinase protein